MSDFSGYERPMEADMGRSATASGRRLGRGNRLRACLRLGLFSLLAAAPAACWAAAIPDAAGLPPLVRTKHRTFAIPFRLPESKDPDADAAPQRVILNVSRDLGATWAAAGETSPTAGSFTFTGDVDGEYWFRLRAIDKKGRSRGGEGPDIRVLVDAAGPRLAARLWRGADGEIICRYAATDDSLRLDSLQLEYRSPEDRGWKKVAADAVLAREAPAHLVGEAIWWAGEKVDQLVARIEITDASGNRTERKFSLEPTDPQVDQAGLAAELGIPALPSQSSVAGGLDGTTGAEMVARDPGGLDGGFDAGFETDSATRSVLAGSAGQSGDAFDDGRGDPSSWPAEPATWNGRDPDRSTSASGTQAAKPPAGPRIAAAAGLLPRADDAPGRRAARTVSAADPLAAAGIVRPNDDSGPLEYRGRPLHLARSRRFAWDYEIPAVRRVAGPLHAELWTTRDGGLTWQRAASDDDGRSPIDVELAEPGFYGVRLELVADVPDAEAGPRSGAEPDAWVGVDEEPPQIELVGVERDETAVGDVLLIHYAARDPLLAANATRLLYSPNADGPWATIATDAANEGIHRWEPGRNVPARVFIRVEATDAAGNKGFAATDEAISIAPTRFGGRLGGLRVLPTP
jgi:uncharacterized protein (DUF736 family)